MTDDQRAFLAAIQAEPDSDTHRLVYADWLQEQGREDRAALIRVQIAGTILPVVSPPWCVTTRVAKKEKSALVWRKKSQKTEAKLIASVLEPYCSAKQYAWFRFARGFITQLSCPWDDWCDVGDPLREAEWVPQVHLRDEPILKEHPEETATARTYTVAGRVIEVKIAERNPQIPTVVAEATEDALSRMIALMKRWPGTLFDVEGWGFTLSPART